MAWRESTLSYRKAFNWSKTSTAVDIFQQHSSNDFMNYFTSKINTIRDQTVTMQLQYHIKLCTIDPLRNNFSHSLL